MNTCPGPAVPIRVSTYRQLFAFASGQNRTEIAEIASITNVEVFIERKYFKKRLAFLRPALSIVF
jgi:hypothetical protein